ncbi:MULTISPECIES: hypothetical protein [Stenotrophomonas]|uniref:hypothetical protein n=1 Tax=Stenotrophomonas TaxID=40323 RepID=UPI000B6DC281|nr:MULTISPECIES: hypothetical protein [Stenotrophomonas]SMR70459.1 hypothetical protein SAMN04487863_1202 [Stenotrophomonas sp. yr243]SNT51857.1 hypothetical protein SAMN05518671_2709 [Stenotrophomonas lactitubi]
MIPASLDNSQRMIADTLAAFRYGSAFGSAPLRSTPLTRPPLYIGIAGGKGVGKDALANGLASALALPCDSFAARLRQGTSTEGGRGHVHPELWVRSLFSRLPAGGLVPDVHSTDEARAIRRQGGVVIRITRPGCDSVDLHAGGQPLPATLVDIELHNDRSVADLVRMALNQLMGRGVV